MQARQSWWLKELEKKKGWLKKLMTSLLLDNSIRIIYRKGDCFLK